MSVLSAEVSCVILSPWTHLSSAFFFPFLLVLTFHHFLFLSLSLSPTVLSYFSPSWLFWPHRPQQTDCYICLSSQKTHHGWDCHAEDGSVSVFTADSDICTCFLCLILRAGECKARCPHESHQSLKMTALEKGEPCFSPRCFHFSRILTRFSPFSWK